MEFDLSEIVHGSFDHIVGVLQDPEYYHELGNSSASSVKAPELLSATEENGVIDLSVRYAFAGTISGPAAMAIDTDKLTWVIHTTIDRATRQATLDVVADHYADMFTCDATAAFSEKDGETIQTFSGTLNVHIPLFAETVERVILNGLESHIAMEATALNFYCAKKTKE